MTQLYAYNPNRIHLEETLDVLLWKKLYKAVNANISFIDRTGFIKLPIKTATPVNLLLPKFTPNFNLSYTDCCQLQVKSLLQKQEQIDKPIRIMYSGGIDSSMVLTSFINELGLNECAKRLEIVMSTLSIDENPAMWEKILRRSNIKLINSLEFDQSVNPNYLLVAGEFNDQLFGSAMIKPLLKWKTAEELLKPRSLSILIEYFLWIGLEKIEAEHWGNLLHGLAENAENEIYSTWDVFWWLNFTCKWSSVYFRFLMFNPQQSISKEYLENHYVQFFGTEEFQQWSMNDTRHKHQGTWDSYKWYPRKLVADFLKDDVYLNKVKRGSLYHVVRARQSNDAMDSNYQFIDLSTANLYQPLNSFV
jgi:hypothetical protein